MAGLGTLGIIVLHAAVVTAGRRLLPPLADADAAGVSREMEGGQTL